MPTSYTPADTKPASPFSLVNDGENVTHDNTYKSASAGLGLFAKILDWLTWLTSRTPGGTKFLAGKLTTDGAGNVAITESTGGFTAAISGANIRLTFAARTDAHYTLLAGEQSTTPGSAGPGTCTTTTADIILNGVSLAANARVIHFVLIDAN